MQVLQDDCRSEWDAMSEADRHAWKMQGEGNNLAAILAEHADVPLVPLPEPPLFKPWADCGCSARPVSLDAIATELTSARPGDRSRLAFYDPALCVSAAPARASTLPPGMGVQQGMWGCFASKRICRVTMANSQAAALDVMTRSLQSWVDSLGGRDVVKKAESLVCFRGAHPRTGLRKDIIALLVFSRQQPVIHFYAKCDIKGASPDDVPAVMPDALPFVASIRVVRSRLSNNYASVDIMSSEEISHEMVQSQMEW